MRFFLRWLLLSVIVLLILALPSKTLAVPTERGLGDEIIFGESFTLQEGETLNGDLLSFGGNITLEEGSVVSGDIVMFGGSLDASGEIGGGINAFGSIVSLLRSANIDDDVVMIGTNFHREDGSRIGGQVITGTSFQTISNLPFTFMPHLPVVRNLGPWIAWDWLWFLFRMFLWALLGLLLAMFFLKPLEHTASTVLSQPILSWGVGTLTLIVLPVILLFLAVTIILIPVTLVGFLALVVTCFFGWVAIGFEVGRNLNHQLNQQWTPVVATSIGTFVVSLVAFGIAKLVPCIGWLVPIVIFPVGFGALMLTRFGTRAYPPENVAASIKPIPSPLTGEPPSTDKPSVD